MKITMIRIKFKVLCSRIKITMIRIKFKVLCSRIKFEIDFKLCFCERIKCGIFVFNLNVLKDIGVG